MERIAILAAQCRTPDLWTTRRPIEEKRAVPRFAWFASATGADFYIELDAMNPNDLRALVETMIQRHIDPVPWERAAVTDAAQRRSIEEVLTAWPR